MISKEYTFKKREIYRKTSSIIQHKLRNLLKCYTIVNFKLDEEAKTYTFKKSHRINGLRMDDPKEYTGRFEILPATSEEMAIIKLIMD